MGGKKDTHLWLIMIKEIKASGNNFIEIIIFAIVACSGKISETAE